MRQALLEVSLEASAVRERKFAVSIAPTLREIAIVDLIVGVLEDTMPMWNSIDKVAFHSATIRQNHCAHTLKLSFHEVSCHG